MSRVLIDAIHLEQLRDVAKAARLLLAIAKLDLGGIDWTLAEARLRDAMNLLDGVEP